MFQIALYNEETNKIIARSEEFSLSSAIDLLGAEDHIEITEKIYITFNNLEPENANTDGGKYSKTFKMKIKSISRLQRMSVFNIYNKVAMGLIPVIGIDFSTVNLDHHGEHKLHDYDPTKPNIYEKILKELKHITKIYEIEYVYPYFVGAQINRRSGPIPLYPFTEDHLRPLLRPNELVKKYVENLNQIGYGEEVNHASIFENACSIASLGVDTEDYLSFSGMHRFLYKFLPTKYCLIQFLSVISHNSRENRRFKAGERQDKVMQRSSH